MQNTVGNRGRTARVSSEPLGPLDAYFRDVSAHELLTRDDELRLAREIEAVDVNVWLELLSFAPTLPYVLGLVESCLENSLPAFSTLRGLATQARKKRTKASSEALRRAACKVAPELRALDLDRRNREAVLGNLKRLSGGLRRAALGFSPSSAGYKSYMARVNGLVREAQRLRRVFINSNLRLVVTVARKYRLGGMPLEDLIQEGNLGLMKAVDRFDHRRGLRFSTYATWWIRHNVGRALAEKSRTIRLPVHIVDSRQRIARVRRELTLSLGRAPTIAEVAEGSDLTVEKVTTIDGSLPERGVSLDQPMGSVDSDRTRMEIFQDPHALTITPHDKVESKLAGQVLRGLIERLKPIEADVLRLRFGLDDYNERTLQSVANKYGLSRERIRQIQEEAFGKLRRLLKGHGAGDERALH